MNQSRNILILLLCLGCSSAAAQPADSTRYFPLELGNSWTYYHLQERHDAPPDTGIGLPTEISEMLSVVDTVYYLAPHPEGFADTLREDAAGRIWARVLGKDVLLFDFTLEESGSYSFDPTNWPHDTYEVRIERNITVDVVAGHFENCVRLTFDIPEAVDDEKSFTFAPGIGLVVSSHWGEGTYLYEAVVGNRVISKPKTYYPLTIGNSWRYNGLEYSIDDTVAVNDTLYYIVPNPWAFADTLRQSDDGNIWARSLSKDILLYDFSIADSATYISELSTGSPELRWTVSVLRNVTVDTPAGAFEGCIVLWFDIPEVADDEHGFIFAPGVGIVRLSDVWVGNRDLVSAVVGNRVISLEDDLPTSVSTEAAAYPNPFLESTTVRFPNRGAISATATVYDVLGRSVAKLTSNDCIPERCTFRWNGQHAPNGLYFVVSDGDSREAVSVVLAR